jgi:trimethylamine--corrinoid protein Co-methyltransferase
MAVVRLRLMDRSEEDLIHNLSLKVLREIGVLVRSPSVLSMLKKAGAEVDDKKMIAKIPESVIQDALKKAPKEILCAARDPKYDMKLPVQSWPYMATTGLAIYMKDIDTGKTRETTRKDLADFAKLADVLPQVDYFWPCVTAGDVPQQIHTIHELWTSLQYQTKHIEGDSISAIDARKQIELASMIVGGEKELKKRPIFSVVSCPIAPLSFEKGSIEGQVEFAKAGIPVSSLSMSLSGGSAPVTLAGTLVNANAENLASISITQIACPGAPHIYGSNSTPIDMNTGNIDYTAVEQPAISAGLGQMAARYKLPCQISDWGVDAEDLGVMKTFSELTSSTLTNFCGSDLAQGIGSWGHAKGAALEQMVIDAYAWENYRLLINKFTVNEQTAAVDVIKEVGHGGSYLTNPHTLKCFRKELHQRNKKTVPWEATMSNRMVPEAREIAKKLLKEHAAKPIDKEIVKRGDELIKSYEKSSIP